MTYEDFILAYHNPFATTDEQADEGLYYTRGVMDALAPRYCSQFALFLTFCRKIMQVRRPNAKAEECSPLWKKTILAALCDALLTQGTEIRRPAPGQTIARSDAPYSIEATVIEIPHVPKRSKHPSMN